MAQALAPSDHRSDSDDDGEEKEENFFPVPTETEDEFPTPSNALIVDGIVIPAAGDLAKKSTAKRTKDIKWTTAMEEKLLAAVFSKKAHINTDIPKYKKWDLV